MKKFILGIGLLMVSAMAIAPSVATADFFDNFDSYALGNSNGQGPWVDFGGNLPANISNAQAFSASQSLELTLSGTGNGYGSDTYVVNLNGAPVTTGVWLASAQIFVPTAFNGQAHLFFSQGAMPTTFDEGAWIRVNNNAGVGTINTFDIQAGPTPAALVLNQWARLDLLIDLGANTLSASYNGSVFHTRAWDVQTPGGFTGIGGINFWVDNGTAAGSSVFIDNVSLTQIPEPTSMTFTVFGLLGLVGLRRKR